MVLRYLPIPILVRQSAPKRVCSGGQSSITRETHSVPNTLSCPTLKIHTYILTYIKHTYITDVLNAHTNWCMHDVHIFHSTCIYTVHKKSKKQSRNSFTPSKYIHTLHTYIQCAKRKRICEPFLYFCSLSLASSLYSDRVQRSKFF